MDGGRREGSAIYGETDDFSYNIVRDPLHIHDFHATILKLLGFDHERFTVKFEDSTRLTGVEEAGGEGIDRLDSLPKQLRDRLPQRAVLLWLR
ncbi:MAG: DUF1501 domain-containing protein [Verrucomicrobiales bacterium]